jgi:hypothetical protein
MKIHIKTSRPKKEIRLVFIYIYTSPKARWGGGKGLFVAMEEQVKREYIVVKIIIIISREC